MMTPGPDGSMVPWITSWSGEEGFAVKPCRYAGNELALWQPHAPGKGRPLFKSRHVVRARKAVAEGLCTICGIAISHGERWLFPRAKALHQRDGSTIYTINEPFVHQACSDMALKLCPHIRKEGWTAYHFTAKTGLMDILQAGSAVNAAFGTKVHPDATVLVGTYVTVSKQTFDELLRLRLLDAEA